LVTRLGTTVGSFTAKYVNGNWQFTCTLNDSVVRSPAMLNEL